MCSCAQEESFSSLDRHRHNATATALLAATGHSNGTIEGVLANALVSVGPHLARQIMRSGNRTVLDKVLPEMMPRVDLYW